MAPRLNQGPLMTPLRHLFPLLLFLASVLLRADLVVTTDGSRLQGEILSISVDGNLTLSTTYAGDLRIPITNVTSIQTDESARLRLDDNRTLTGLLAPAPAPGVLNVGAPPTAVALATVRHLWRVPEEDPLLLAEAKLAETRRMKWTNALGFNLSGASGNTEDFGLGFRLDSSYRNKKHGADLYLSYNKSHKESLTILDETKTGAEYDNRFSNKLAWYAKTDLETDRLEEIDLRATAATGLKYLFHKTENRSLSLRAGAAFRYEAYEAAALGDLDDPAIDFGIEHSREFSEFLSIQSDVTYVPAFDEFSDYLLTQETALVVPLGKKSPWKLSSGLSNSYVSSPAPGNKGLDLKYYLRLTYSWE